MTFAANARPTGFGPRNGWANMPFAGWLLGMAVLGLLAQSALLPITAPWTAAWDPAHAHLSLNGAVPRHEHMASGARSGGGCVVAPGLEASPEVEDAAGLMCASHPSEAMSAAPALPGPAAVVRVDPAGFESYTPLATLPAWSSAMLEVVTPPPRPHTQD